MEKEIIIYYLQHNDLEQKLWKRAREVRRNIFLNQEEMESFRTEMLYTSQVEVRISDTPRSKTNHINDIQDVIDQTDNRLRSYEKELLYEYNKILEQLDMCKRVYLAYGTLLPLDREIIKKLYIDNEKWAVVENETGINHSILVRTVNEIFDTLSEKIDSNLSNSELARQTNTFKLLKPLKGRKVNETINIKGQKNVYDYFPILKEENNVKEE